MTLDDRLDAWGRGWRGPLLAALLALIAALPSLFTLPSTDRDESRFAEASAQMLESGDLISIHFQDEPRFKKPVGIYWLQAASVRILSQVEDRAIWAYRVPSALGAMLAAAACAWGAAVFLRPGLALMAGAMLGASTILSTEASLATTDACLAGAVSLAMAGLLRLYLASRDGPPAGRWARPAVWVGLALSILLKGPVGPMIFALALLALMAWDRKAGWATRIGWGWGLIFTALVVGPWALAVTVATDGGFWGAAIGGDLTPKLMGGQESHGLPPGFHTLVTPALLFPASLLLPAAAALAWRARAEGAVRFALCWLLPSWILFEIVPTKLPHYTLPLYGALAWLMARALAEPLGVRVARGGAILAVVVGLAAAAVAPALAGLLQAGDAAPWAMAASLAYLAAAAAGAWFMWRRQAMRALLICGVLGVAAHGLLFGAVLPSAAPLWLSSRAAAALTRSGANPRGGMTPGPVAVAGYAEPSLVFALGASTELGGGADAAAAIAAGRPAIVEAREEAAFRAALAENHAAGRLVGRVEGLDYSNGQHDILRIYRPAEAP